MIITNIDYNQENTLDIIHNGKISSIHFNNLYELADEVISRTCVFDGFNTQERQENVVDCYDNILCQICTSDKGFEMTLKQVVPISVVKDDKLAELVEILIKKGLEINTLDYINIDSAMPKLFDFKINIERGFYL